MSILYNLLHNKNIDCPSNVLYIESFNKKEYCFLDFYNLVNNQINKIREKINSTQVYLVVDNSVESLASFVACLYLDLNPIVISLKQVNNYEKKEKNDVSYSIYSCHDIDIEKTNSYINNFIDNKGIIDYNVNGDGKCFYIQTSGTTTGIPKLVKKYESDLLKDVEIFKSNQKEVYYSSSDISKLSGLWLQLFVAISLNNHNIIVLSDKTNDNDLLECLNKYSITRIFKPKNLSSNIYNGCNNSLNRVYVAGEVTNKYLINKLIEDFGISLDKITNIYGQTEFGLISTCSNIIPDSFNISVFYGKEEYIFPDKYVRTSLGKFSGISKEYLAQLRKYYTGNNQLTMFIQSNNILADFVTLYPVSERVVKDIKLVDIKCDNQVNSEFWKKYYGFSESILKEIYYKNISTGDVGFYYDDKLYICGRKSEVINDCITLPIIESTLQETFYNTHAIYSEKEDMIYLISGINLNYNSENPVFLNDFDLKYSSFYLLNCKKKSEFIGEIKTFNYDGFCIPDYQIVRTSGLGKFDRNSNYELCMKKIKKMTNNSIYYWNIMENKVHSELSKNAIQIEANYFCIDENSIDIMTLLKYLKDTVSSLPILKGNKYYFYINDYFMYEMTKEDLLFSYPTYKENDVLFNDLIVKEKVKKKI